MKLFANLFWTISSYQHCLCLVTHLPLSLKPSLMPLEIWIRGPPHALSPSHTCPFCLTAWPPSSPTLQVLVGNDLISPFTGSYLVLPSKGIYSLMLNKYLIKEWASLCQFQKNIYFCFIDYAKGFDCVHHNKLWKEMGIPDHLTCLLRNLYVGQETTVRTGHGTIDWFQIGKGVRQCCMLSSCLFNFICRVHHEKHWAGGNTSWNQDCWGKYQYPQIGRWHHPYGRKWRRTKESLDESEREWKSWLKVQHLEN